MLALAFLQVTLGGRVFYKVVRLNDVDWQVASFSVIIGLLQDRDEEISVGLMEEVVVVL